MALSRFCMISSPLGWFLKVRLTVRPSRDLDGLRLGVDEEAVRRAGLCDHHALAGGQPLDADLTVLVGPVDAVAVTDKGAVRICDFELRVAAGSHWGPWRRPCGPGGSVRHVLKAHRDGRSAPRCPPGRWSPRTG